MKNIQKNSSEPIITPQAQIPHTTWVEIDAHAFEHNLQNYKAIIGSVALAPVIKSNAYGHGIELIAKLCEKSSAVDRMCVVALSEAVKVRMLGITKPIVVLSILDADLELAATYDIAVVVYDLDTARKLNEIGKKYNKKMNVHIKIDTGLSRLGIVVENSSAIIKSIGAMLFISLQGIFTHFAESEKEDQTFTNLQIERFTNLIDELEESGIHIPLKHTTCSAAITGNASSHFTLSRAGIGMYGLWPSLENQIKTVSQFPGFTLKPVLTWKTRIIQIKQVAAGSYIGYDRTHQVIRDTTLAVLPIGYWDGYDRGLSNKGKVLIHNTLAPIIGRVAMNLMMIDITDICPTHVGTEVILLGNHTGITANDLAQNATTINYEIVTRINPLLPRIIKL